MRVLLIAYDNDAYMHWFPMGLGYIAAVLEAEGCEVEIYSQDYHHYPEEHLTEALDAFPYDLVGLGFCGGYYQVAKARKISAAVNASKNRSRFMYVLGGHGPAPEPEWFAAEMGADHIVVGEGEWSAWRYVNREGDAYPYCEGIDSIPFPAWHLFPMHYYRLMRQPGAENTDFMFPVLTSRGCPFKCNFCYRMTPGHKFRKPEAVLEEIGTLQRDYGITYIYFYDELVMAGEERTEELCKAFIKHRPGFKWLANGRLNYAKPAMLRLMKEAGCVFVNYGIESCDDLVLRNMNKALTYKQIIHGVEATIAEGLTPGLNMLWGNIGDNADTLRKATDFLLRYDNGAQLRAIKPVTPYPGSELYYQAIEASMISGVEDFYCKHVNSDLASVQFTGLSNEEFHHHLYTANHQLLENYFFHKKSNAIKQAHDLYINGDASFRGWRAT
jgi:radical SAM superfamily enzyme YgiQ (UPF0313 family)